jgi:hypothetical protein
MWEEEREEEREEGTIPKERDNEMRASLLAT